jgi:hypothetical protein
MNRVSGTARNIGGKIEEGAGKLVGRYQNSVPRQDRSGERGGPGQVRASRRHSSPDCDRP